MLAPPLLAISTVVSVKGGAAEGQKMPIESDDSNRKRLEKGFVEEGREAQCSPSNPFEPLHVGRSPIPKGAHVGFHTICAVERLR